MGRPHQHELAVCVPADTFEGNEVFKRSFLNLKGYYREVAVEDPPPELTAESLGDFMDCVALNLDDWYNEHEPGASDIDRLLHILGNVGTEGDPARSLG